MTLKIISNYQWRNELVWEELSPKEQKEFDWMDSELRQEATFGRYRNWVYYLGDFMRTPDEMKPWDGYAGDSYFSGVLIRLSRDDAQQIMFATYYS